MRELNETFTVEDGALVRRVVPARGQPYEHRCPLAALAAIAHAIDELDGAAFTMEMLRDKEDLPHSQAAVAVAFLKERGALVPVHGRKHRLEDGACAHLEALTEYHALAWRQQHPHTGEPT